MYRFKNTLHYHRSPNTYFYWKILLHSSDRRQFIGLITYKIHFYIYYFKSSVRGICTRMFTGTNSGCSLLYGFRAHLLETDRAVFAAGFSYEPKRRTVYRINRSSVGIKVCVGGFRIALIHRNAGTAEIKFVFK